MSLLRNLFMSALKLNLTMAACLAFCSLAQAVVIVENFESQTAGSSTVPSGWTLVTAAGAPTYATTAAGAGSNEMGGSGGLAGRVSSTAFVNTNHPGGYLINNTVLDATKSVRGRFDFYIVHEATFDDITFSFGDIGTSVSGAAGKSITFKAIEGTDTELLASGTNAVLTGADDTSIIDDTWFRGRFQWTPTGGTTGNFSVTVENFTANLFTRSTTGFTLDSAAAQIGFGSVNDTLRFDNVNVATGPAVISSLTNIDTNASTISTSSGKAINFTMSGTGDFKLTEIVLDLSGIGAGDNPLVELWSDDGSGIGSLLETLVDPLLLSNGFNLFSSSLGSLLLEGETYWVVVRSESGSFDWRGSSTLSTASDFGATHSGRLFGGETPGDWASTSSLLNLMQVNAILIPEPHTFLLGALGMIGVALCGRRRAVRRNRGAAVNRILRRQVMTLKHTLQCVLGMIIAVSIAGSADAVVIASYDFAGGSGASSDVDPDSLASTFNVAPIGGTISNVTSTVFVGSHLTVDSTTTAVSNNDYVGFSVDFGSYSYNLTSLTFDYWIDSAFADSFYGVRVMNSVTGFVDFGTAMESTNAIADNVNRSYSHNPTVTGTTAVESVFVDLTDPYPLQIVQDDLQWVSGLVEFRFYLVDNTSGDTRYHRLDNIVLQGELVPEVSAWAIAVAAFLGLVGFAWRRRASGGRDT